MSPLSRDSVLAALEGSVDAALVSGVVVRGGHVGFLIHATEENAAQMEAVRRQCERVVGSLPGVEKVTAVLTAEKAAPTPEKSRPSVWNRQKVEGVRHIIAIASGKGGVGKSSITVCLAHALNAKGLRVGILDADIYGPSIPLMLGISGKPDAMDGKLLPAISHGIACMSIGLLLEGEAAVVRAPIITKTLTQMLRGTRWDALDILLIDLPPGTGDVHLSLAQQVPLSGALVVTTPPRVALADARKAVDMFRKTAVPVLGIVENMSWLEQGDGRAYPFGQGGGEALAAETGLPLLGSLPLLPELGAALDRGERPPQPPALDAIAQQVLAHLPSPAATFS